MSSPEVSRSLRQVASLSCLTCASRLRSAISEAMLVIAARSGPISLLTFYFRSFDHRKVRVGRHAGMWIRHASDDFLRSCARAAATGDGRSGLLDLDEAIVKSCGAAQIGYALRSDLIGVAPVGRELLPPHRQRDDHAPARLTVDARDCGKRPAIVEYAHAIAIAQAPRRGVLGMQL